MGAGEVEEADGGGGGGAGLLFRGDGIACVRVKWWVVGG